MSKKAAEHRKKASEHMTHAARHHGEAAKHHEGGSHEKAAHHAHVARGHVKFTQEDTLKKRLRPISKSTAKSKSSRKIALPAHSVHPMTARLARPGRLSSVQSFRRIRSGSFAKLLAIRRASSANRAPGRRSCFAAASMQKR